MNDHQFTIENLSWFVNDTLVGNEKERVRNHIGECLVCQQEWRAQKRIAASVGAAAVLPPAHESLAALSDRLDADGLAGRSLRARLRGLFVATPRPVRLAMAVQFVALVALISIFVAQPGDSSESGEFRTRSSDAPLAGDLRVVFSTGAGAAEIDAFIRTHDATVVSGPSELGVYTLALAGDLTDVEIDALRDDELVEFAERPSAGRD